MSKTIYAKDLKCCTCKTEQAVAFWPACDPDIQSFPYCRKCLDEAKTRVLIKIMEIDKKDN